MKFCSRAKCILCFVHFVVIEYVKEEKTETVSSQLHQSDIFSVFFVRIVYCDFT